MGHRRNWSSEYQSLALGQLERVIRQHREGLICERTGRATDRLKVPWAAGRQLHRPFTDLESRDQFTPNVINRRRKSEKGHSSCPPCPPKALLLPSLSRFLLLLDMIIQNQRFWKSLRAHTTKTSLNENFASSAQFFSYPKLT